MEDYVVGLPGFVLDCETLLLALNFALGLVRCVPGRTEHDRFPIGTSQITRIGVDVLNSLSSSASNDSVLLKLGSQLATLTNDPVDKKPVIVDAVKGHVIALYFWPRMTTLATPEDLVRDTVNVVIHVLLRRSGHGRLRLLVLTPWIDGKRVTLSAMPNLQFR